MSVYLDDGDGILSGSSDVLIGTSEVVTIGEAEVAWCDPGDSRINRQCAAYAAVYCDDANQRIAIYGITLRDEEGRQPGEGYPAIFVNYDAVPPVPTQEQGNQLIDQYGPISLYRLTTGEFQVNAGPDAEGKYYVLIWDGCPHTYIQAFIEQNGVRTPTEVYPHPEL